jgi:hypothetical protein
MANILKSDNDRFKLMRQDTAEILTRIFFIERSLIISQAGWVTRAPRLEDKAVLSRLLWEDSLAADDMRERIFELRYPRRDVNIDLHTAVVSLYDEARNAPSVEAFVMGMANVLKPALLEAYSSFNEVSDRISDGPSALILRHAMDDLKTQIGDLESMLDVMLTVNPKAKAGAQAWAAALQKELAGLGGKLLDTTTATQGKSLVLPNRVPFDLPARPARDARFKNQRFYWPHIIDPEFSSADGIHLQLRSAIGHLNEAWAAEAAAIILYAFADALEWEFIMDVARWTYDESRHCLMGYHRLMDWGYAAEELPMGDYLYTVAMEQGPLYALALLHHFETKFIHRGRERIETFTEYDDDASRHDYEFDWADETFHAEYGRRWLDVLFGQGAVPARDINDLGEQCHQLVEAKIASATEEEKIAIREIADQIIQKAEERIGV